MKHILLLIILTALTGPLVLAQDNKPVTKTLVWPDGTRYVGGVVDGLRSGKGTIFWQDGSRFVGHFKNDKRNGPGTMILPDGTIFTGFFKDDELVDTRETLSATPSETSTIEQEPIVTPQPKEEQTDEIATQLPIATEQDTKTKASAPEAAPEPQPEPAPLVTAAVNADKSVDGTVNEITDAIQEDVIRSIEMWRIAWSDQDVESYLTMYADDFKTPNGQARSSWESTRRSRLLRPAFIEIGVTYERFELLEPDVIDVQFMQTFRSNTYADETLKSLQVRRTDNGWKIVRERSLNIKR